MRSLRRSRDWLIVAVLFILLAALTGVLAQRQAEAANARGNFTSYSSHSAYPNGTLGLYNWLETMGYRPERAEGDVFRVNPAARLLFIFSTRLDLTDQEVSAVRSWVEQGNTLVLCDALPRNQRLWSEFRADMASFSTATGDLPLDQPVANDKPIAVNVSPVSSLSLKRNDYVTYLSDRGNPLLVSFQQGKGRVWLCTVPSAFDNASLEDDANSALAGAFLTGIPPGSVVVFDEFHLEVARPVQSIQTLLVSTPWGWAIILAFVILIGYLILNGRRFGRVQPLPQELARRNPAEYVVSMAQLFRRGGQRGMVLRHYRQQLKRRLARPYGINPDLPDEQFVAALARQKDNLDQAALAETLRGLSAPSVDDRTLVKLAAQSVAFTTRTSDQGKPTTEKS